MHADLENNHACVRYIKKEICDIITLYKIARFVANGRQRIVARSLDRQRRLQNIYVNDNDHCAHGEQNVSIYLHNYFEHPAAFHKFHKNKQI